MPTPDGGPERSPHGNKGARKWTFIPGYIDEGINNIKIVREEDLTVFSALVK